MKRFLNSTLSLLHNLPLSLVLWCLSLVLIANGIFVYSHFHPSLVTPQPAPSPPLSSTDTSLASQPSTSSVLAANVESVLGNVSFNIPSYFTDTATFDKDATFFGKVTFNGNVQLTNQDLNLGSGKLTASNVLYSLTAGNGISVSGSQDLIVSNTGVTSLQGKTGDVALQAGNGISIDGLTISSTENTPALLSALGIFNTIAVGGTSFSASTNTDILTFNAIDGLSVIADPATKAVTFSASGSALNVSGWIINGSTVSLTNINNSVGIGTNNPAAKLDVVGSSILAGAVMLGSISTDTITVNGTLTPGTSIIPSNDLGSDLGSPSKRFNNLYVANINSNSGFSTAGQAVFTYSPLDTTYGQSSVMINPTTAPASSNLLGIGIAGNQRAGIDAEGDLTLGYNGLISIPTTDYPLNIYNHSTTLSSSIDTSGNAYFLNSVGIGTHSSSAKLTLSGSGTTNGIIIGSDQSSPITLYYNDTDVNNPNSLDIVANRTVLEGGYITFSGNPYIQGALKFNGNNAQVDGSSLTFKNADNSAKYSIVNSGGTGLGVLGFLNNAGSQVVTFDNSGKVGIGISNPGFTFDVGGGSGLIANVGALYINGNSDQSLFRAPLSNVYGTNGSHQFQEYLGKYDGGLLLSGAGSITGVTIDAGASGRTAFYNGTSTQRMVIDSSGNVSIGSSNQFTVDGSGNVVTSGTISSPTFQGNSGAVQFGNSSYASTLVGSSLTLSTASNGNINVSPNGTGSVVLTSGVTTGTGVSSALSMTANSLTSGYGLYGSSSSLTTGSLAYLSSTSTALTTGSLLSLDWSPTTTTTATGDLFSINVGANGTIGNLLNLKDNGSSIFSVSQAGITANVPASFNSSGDVGIANDLNFTNSVASYIKSSAPLYLQSGETYNSSNLTLKTFNSGQGVFDFSGGVTLNQAQNWVLGSATNALNFQDAATNSILNLDTTNDRVGIGFTNPSQLLTLASTGILGWDNGSGTADVLLQRDGANVLSLRNGSNAQTFNVYAIYTSSSGYSGISLTGNTIIGIGAGGGTRDITLAAGGSSTLHLGSGNTTSRITLDSTGNLNVNSGQFYVQQSTGNIGIGTISPNGLLDISKSISGTPSLTAPYLSLSSSTYTDNNTAAAGTATNMVFNSLSQDTLAATNTGVITTNAYGLYIGGAPTGGTNETLTNSTALNIASGALTNTTNGYGLRVNAPVGAINNYSAIFNGGNVGIGTSSPTQLFDLYAGNHLLDYSNIQINQTTTPNAPSLALISSSGNLGVGTYRYAVTFVTSIGESSVTSNQATITTTAGNQQVSITNIPTGPSSVIARKIYRTTVGGVFGNAKLLTTINDNTTTTFVDNIADTSLGSSIASLIYTNQTGGAISINGTLTESFLPGQVVLPNGTNSFPSIIFGGTWNTNGENIGGIYSSGDGSINFSTQGNNTFTFSQSSGVLTIGSGNSGTGVFQGRSASNGNTNFGGINLVFNAGTGTGTATSMITWGVPDALPNSSTTLQTVFERMRLDPSGDLAIGNSSPQARLDLSGGLNFSALTPPLRAPTIAGPSSGGSVTAGSHSYKVTFTTSQGETIPSSASSVITTTVANGTVSLSNIPLGPPGSGVIARKIYRTIAGNTGNYLLLATIADNTTTTYTDTLSDGSLGTSAPTTDTSTSVANIMTGGTSKMFIDSSGNVGIGNTSPLGLLDISKSLSGTPSLTAPYLSLSASIFTDNNTAASGTATNMAFNSIATPTLAATNTGVITTNAYSFYIAGAPTTGTNETITNPISFGVGTGNSYFGGNVGIGTTSPNSTLQLGSQGGTATTTTLYGSSNTFRVLRSSDGTNYFTVDPGSSTINIGSSSTLRTNGIAISGTSSSGTASTYLSINGGAYWNNSSGISETLKTSGTFQGTSTASFNGLDVSPILNFSGTGNYTALYINPTETAVGSTTNYLLNAAVGGNSKFVITSTGNVGIADTTPQNTLKITGSLCVSSTTGACAGNVSGTIYASNTTVQAADLAENYVSSQKLDPGDLIMPANDGNTMAVIKSTSSYQNQVIGVVSTKPGVTLNSDAKVDGTHPYMYPIALKGRAPVKVSTENGNIHTGDYLTSSSTSGVAMKATKSGEVIGEALEDYHSNDIGKIMVFVNISFADPTIPNTTLTLDTNGNIITPTIDSRVTKLEQEVNTIEEILKDKQEIASSSSLINNTTPSLTTKSITNLLENADLVLNNLTVFSTTSLRNTYISGLFTQGNTFTINNGKEINVIGVPSDMNTGILYLQDSPLANGVDIFSGKVIIDKNGNAYFAGTITSPTSISTPDIISNKLHITTESIATPSATVAPSLGTGTIPASQTAITINTSQVTDNSEIFITPTTATGDHILVVSNQISGKGFTVSIAKPFSSDIKFNWWIVDKR